MYLYGASGHAKVIIDLLEAQGIPIDALYDDRASSSELFGYPILRPVRVEGPLIVSIGDNAVRKRIAEARSCAFGTAIHLSAVVSPRAAIGAGTVVMQGAVVQSDARIGRHCIVNTGATVDHECTIGDYAHISPNASLCGNVSVGEGTQIGAGSVVVPGIRIGKWSLVCAGSVVTRDIPDYCVAAGNRCKVLRTMNKERCNPDLEGGGFLTPE
ncbi:acetyltransferase [uncultured Alistipes sp.]|uniref:acetyltransferase n=1 Tax=uncultured Alistipes sp. TaxID=538949 RepID=UPI0026081F07|nr:acetyltransferase [uncultured Alistipes sp.]